MAVTQTSTQATSAVANNPSYPAFPRSGGGNPTTARLASAPSVPDAAPSSSAWTTSSTERFEEDVAYGACNGVAVGGMVGMIGDGIGAVPGGLVGGVIGGLAGVVDGLSDVYG